MESKSLFAERFKSARMMNGFSLQDVSDALNGLLSRQALHRYEKGEVVPDQEKIELISKALNLSTDFFYRDTKIELGEIEYRINAKISQKDEAIINETTKEYLSRYLELEEILSIDTVFNNPIKNFGSVTTYEQVNQAANEVRKAWCLGTGSIFNVVELLEDHKIKVVKLDVSDDFEGLQTEVIYNDNIKVPIVAYNINKTNKPDRIRLTLLHELAHLLLEFGDVTHAQKEKLCFQFAGAMLLPESIIKTELGDHRNKLSMNELGNVKKQYGISMQAITMRAKDTSIINEHYTKQFFFLFKQMNWKIDEPFDYNGVEESNRFEQILFRALIENQIDTRKAASLMNMSEIDFKNKYQTLFL
jgi:Zn-dependent peptidase ImmA (M78 family)